MRLDNGRVANFGKLEGADRQNRAIRLILIPKWFLLLVI
jgi:hypothetical protein